MNEPATPGAAADAAAKTNAPTTAGHHPAQPATPVSPASHPNQPAAADDVEPKLPTTTPAKPAAGADPLVAEAQALRAEVEKFLEDDGVVHDLRARHAELLGRARDTLSRSDFAAATGILDVVAGYLNRLGPRP